MELRYERRFERDLGRIRDAALRLRVERAIVDLEMASAIDDVRGIVQLRGSPAHYRVRIGDYRLGIEVAGEAAVLVTFGHRRDFYRDFP